MDITKSYLNMLSNFAMHHCENQAHKYPHNKDVWDAKAEHIEKERIRIIKVHDKKIKQNKYKDCYIVNNEDGTKEIRRMFDNKLLATLHNAEEIKKYVLRRKINIKFKW